MLVRGSSTMDSLTRSVSDFALYLSPAPTVMRPSQLGIKSVAPAAVYARQLAVASILRSGTRAKYGM